MTRLLATRQGLSPPAYGAFTANDKRAALTLLEGVDVKQVRENDNFYLVGLCDVTGEVEPRFKEIIGLPSERILGVVTAPEDIPVFLPNGQLKPPAASNFKKNDRFLSALHSIVASSMLKSSVVKEEAKLADGGWLLLRDYRAPSPRGRAPEPQEFFGAALVSSGIPEPATYLPNDYYHVLSTLYGFPRLGPTYLQAFLRAYPATFQH